MSIKKEVTKELIKKHGSNEADSGSSASQVSILTERINGTKKYSISSTPTIFINEKKYEGSHKYNEFEKAIEELL